MQLENQIIVQADLTDLSVTAASLTSSCPLSCPSVDTVSRVNDVYALHLPGIMSV